MHVKKSASLVAVAVVTALAAAACGSGSDTSTGSTAGQYVGDPNPSKVTTIQLAGASSGVDVTPSCAQPTQLDGFSTCADVAEARKEGSVTFYSADPLPQTQAVVAEFNKQFPDINVTIVYLQVGALFQRITSERAAGVYDADLLINSNPAQVLDFQQGGNWEQYVSPELKAFRDTTFLSNPIGYWSNEGAIFAGLAYNTDQVSAADAPKTWQDLLDPKWAGKVNAKSSIAGLQNLQWYDLGNLYGAQFWDAFGAQKPSGFDSYVQQYDRLSTGDDLVVLNAQYSGYLTYQAKGAHIAFVAPADGMPAAYQAIGIPTKAPHPEAGKLFLDWYLSKPGQEAITANLFLTSSRTDVAPPGDASLLANAKLLFPSDINDYIASQSDFQTIWNGITGVGA